MTGKRLTGIRWLGGFLFAAAAAGCGQTTSKVLERADAASPPSSSLRVDLFFVRSTTSCAIGSPCGDTDTTRCFTLSDGNGAVRVAFAPDSLQFVPPGDARIASANQSQCFRLVLDDTEIAAASSLFKTLRTQVFQDTGGDVNLDIRTHEVTAIEAGFRRFYSGLFLPPSALFNATSAALSRETDLTFALTGHVDPDTGLTPNVDPCTGTNSLKLGGLGGSTYTWIGKVQDCIDGPLLLRTLLIQLWEGLHDLNGYVGAYDNFYPVCGGGTNPSRWFPWIDDCVTDPDWVDCDRPTCRDKAAFLEHILSAHWPRGTNYEGNHCNNRIRDWDETLVDSGGVCDQIGR